MIFFKVEPEHGDGSLNDVLHALNVNLAENISILSPDARCENVTLGQKQICAAQKGMSALPPKADIHEITLQKTL